MKTEIRRNKRGIERDNIALIKAAIENDNSTYRQITEVTGLNNWKIKDLFTKHADLYALYKVRRKMLVEMAADNIQSIIEDKNHPQHFAASKYVLQNYKSDLDEVLDTREDDDTDLEMSIEGGAGVVINFGKKPKKIEDKDEE